MALGDVNGDGRPDLAVANAGDNTVSVLLNTTAAGATTPSFAAQQTFATGSTPRSVALGDVNGDGRPDLALANVNSSTVSVLLNTTAAGAATPKFAAQQTFASLQPTSVALGDVNDDGRPDLAVANVNTSTVSVLLNTLTPITLSGSPATGTIQDDDSPAAIAAVGGSTPQSLYLGFPSYSALAITVRNANGNLVQGVTVTFTAPTSGASGTFPGGATSAVVTSDSNGLATAPPFTANTTAGGPYNVSAVATGLAATVNFVLTNVAPPTLTIAGASQLEGDFGTANSAVFVVTRSGNPGPALLVNYTTQDGTAVAGTDYVATSGTLSYAANQTTATISVPLIGNTVFQPNRSFTVVLSNPESGAVFAAQQTFATGTNPISVASADVNGDGRPDLIVANENSNTVSVLLNTTGAGATTPSFATQQTFATGTNPISVAVADVNGDGRPDLAVANVGSNTVSVLLNTTAAGATTPSFAAQQTFATGSTPDSVAVGDVNGDGRPDLAVANFSSNTVSVLLDTTAAGATMPSFAAQQTFATGSEPFSVAVGDVNGDGRPDLAVANEGSNTVSVLLNTTAAGATTASFASQQTFATGSFPRSVALADVNGDGRPDLAVANEGSNTVSVLLNTTAAGATTPTFAAQQTFATGSMPFAVAVGDVNGDGRPDLIVANETSTTVSVLLNTTGAGATTPSFATQETFATGSQPISVAVADVNGDGQLDLAVANQSSNTVSVLLNTLAPIVVAPSFAAQQTFATGSAPQSVAVGDVNGDGRPDLIVANDNFAGTVSVLLNTTAAGSTTPSFAAQQTFATGSFPRSVTVGDLNGDGLPDLIVANVSSNTVSVLLNTTAAGATAPSFAAQHTFSTGSCPLSFSLGDVNCDGRPDLLVANDGSSTVSVLLNTTAAGATTPSFAAQQTFATGSQPFAVGLADVNGDGLPDLVVANNGSNTVSVLLNTTAAGATTASFAAQQTFATGSGPRSVALADVNGDGRPDLIVADGGSNTLSVLLNTTAAGETATSFAPQQTFATGSLPLSVALADVNGDGRPDLTVANYNSNTVSVLLNTTAAGATTLSFAVQQSFAAGSGPFAVALGDVNGDGRPDLIVANRNSNTVSELLNTLTPITLSGSPATGTILDDDAPAAIAAVGGSTPQSVYLGFPSYSSLAVTVRNANGNLVQGVTVTFTAPSSGSSGTLPGGVTSVMVCQRQQWPGHGAASSPLIARPAVPTPSAPAYGSGTHHPSNFAAQRPTWWRRP